MEITESNTASTNTASTNTASTNTASANIDIMKYLQKAITNIKEGTSLNEKEVNFIKQMMTENPAIFEKVSHQINDIVNKKKLEVSDIPQLLHIICTVYTDEFNCKNVNIINCVQFTLDALIESNEIFNDNISKEILKPIVDFSFGLLKTNVSFIEENMEVAAVSCFNMFRCCK
jgi:hypothetical protein